MEGGGVVSICQFTILVPERQCPHACVCQLGQCLHAQGWVSLRLVQPKNHRYKIKQTLANSAMRLPAARKYPT
jgi:hypothetical protein